MFISVIIFIIILAVLVLVHEFGHFIVAKKSGIRVDEFGLGFPPRVIGWKPKGSETTYSLNWIPFGGFVKIFGENPDEESLTGGDSKRSMAKKNRGTQVAVLVAGVVFNVVFAWIVISGAITIGLPMSVSDRYIHDVHDARVVVTAVISNGPADKAGLKPGDTLTYVEAGENATLKNIQGDNVLSTTVQHFIGVHQDEPIVFLAKRGDMNLRGIMTPESGVIEGKKGVGINMEDFGTLKLPWYRAPIEGAVVTYDLTLATASGLWHFLSDAVMGKADFSQISGPVGISGLVDSARSLGFVYLLSFTALISLNLAVINLLPFPALDGGRILFVIIEAIRRKPLNPHVLNTIHAVGFFILIGLMLLVTYKDIVKLVVR